MNELGAGADALSTALSHQGEVYGSLLDLAAREEQAIIDGDVGVLTAIVDQQEQLLDVLRALETERMTALTVIAAATGEDADALTVTSVSSMLEGAERDALMTLGVALRAQAITLGHANERNSELLSNSRDIVDRWLHYLRSVVSSALTYTASGERDEPGGNRVVDRSA
ncbi:MAG: flagellar protein FlgN [Dehalococcoidia bacterium]